MGFVPDDPNTTATAQIDAPALAGKGRFVPDSDNEVAPTEEGLAAKEGLTSDPSEAIQLLNTPLKKTITGTSFEQDAVNKTGQPGYAPTATSRPFDKYVSGGAGDAVRGKAFNDVTTAQEKDLLTTPSMMAGAAAKLTPELEAAYKTGQYNKILDAHTNSYRKILNPGKNIINSSNVDVDNASKTLAQEGVVIKKDINNKLDNSDGIKQLQAANKPLYNQADKILQSSPDKQFDLRKIGFQAKQAIGQNIKNAEERIAARKQVDTAIKSEISENGGSHIVDAPSVYRIKQGMYERAYTPLEPTSNDGARAIGSVIKDQVEKAFPESPIREINRKIGDRLQAQTLLEKTNGNVVQGGKLGKGLGRIIGGGVGALTGSHIPVLGAPEVGALAGQATGARVVDYMNDPERLTIAMASKMKGMSNPNIPNTTRPGVVNPEIVTPAKSNPNLGINSPVRRDIRPSRGLPSPLDAGHGSGPVMSQSGYVPKGLPEPFMGRSGIDRPYENIGLPSPRQAGQSSGPVIKQGTLYMPPSGPKKYPQTDFGHQIKNQMMNDDTVALHPAEQGRADLEKLYPTAKKGNPNISMHDLQDFNDMKDWELSQNPGGWKSHGPQQDLSFTKSKTGHSEAFKKVSGNSEKEGFDLLRRASSGEEMSNGDKLKIKMMIHDFRKNIKPKMRSS